MRESCVARRLTAGVGRPGRGRQNPGATPQAERPCATWEGVSPRGGTPPDAGRRSAIACRFPAARRAVLHGQGRARAARAVGHSRRVHWDRPSVPPGRCRLVPEGPEAPAPSGRASCPTWAPHHAGRPVSSACRLSAVWRAVPDGQGRPSVRRKTHHGRRGVGARRRCPSPLRAGRACGAHAWRCAAGGWRKAVGPGGRVEPHAAPRRGVRVRRGGGPPRRGGVVRRAVGGEASGEGASRRTPVPAPAPNKGLQATTNSLRSFLAAAIGGA